MAAGDGNGGWRVSIFVSGAVGIKHSEEIKTGFCK